MTPDTLLFDMDGTLLDSRAAVVDAVAEGLTGAYRELKLPVAEPDRSLIEAGMGLPSREYFERTFAPDTVPAERRDAFIEAYARLTAEAETRAIAEGRTELYTGTAEALDALAKRCRLLLFSNAGTAYFRAVITGHGLMRWFTDALCIEEAVARGIAVDKAGMVRAMVGDPARAIVVGDRAGDVEAGRAAGAGTVGCLYGFGSREELGEADRVIDGLGELVEITAHWGS